MRLVDQLGQHGSLFLHDGRIGHYTGALFYQVEHGTGFIQGDKLAVRLVGNFREKEHARYDALDELVGQQGKDIQEAFFAWLLQITGCSRG